MEYAISVHRVTAQPLAAVRDRMAARDIASRFRNSLDKVWQYLGAHPGLRTDGHNVFLYRHDMDSAGADDHRFRRAGHARIRWRR